MGNVAAKREAKTSLGHTKNMNNAFNVHRSIANTHTFTGFPFVIAPRFLKYRLSLLYADLVFAFSTIGKTRKQGIITNNEGKILNLSLICRFCYSRINIYLECNPHE